MFTCSHVEVVAGRESSESFSLSLPSSYSLRDFFTFMASHVDYRLSLFACWPEFCQSGLSCSVVGQVPLSFHHRCVLSNTPHQIIVDAVYAELLLQTLVSGFLIRAWKM